MRDHHRRNARGPSVLCAILAVTVATFGPASAEERWRAKGAPTSFVPDWSKADQSDAEATAHFLKHVWPELSKASESLHDRIQEKTGEAYSGAASEAEKAAGVVCFPLKVEQVLPWYAVPTEQQVAQRKVEIFAARGQSQALGIGVHALRDTGGVSVSCTDLKGPGTIPSSAITSRLSLSYTMDPRGRALGGKNGKLETRQMVLLKVEAWEIAKARTCEWVVDVHVPEAAVPGDYSGKILVKVGDKAAAEFDLALEVLPFALTDNGCRWGAFMAATPGRVTDAWCDLNARYGFNSLAWWKLDEPALTWTWDGIKREELVLAKLRYPDGESITYQRHLNSLPEWVRKRTEGPFVVFRPDEVVGLPRELEARQPFYKKPMKLKPELGELPEKQAQWICYDRPAMKLNFTEKAIESVEFEKNDALATFDRAMKRLKAHGFAGPITWFGAGGPPTAWEVRLISHRFGVKYSRRDWKWRRAVTPENTNHLWYLANAAVAKSFDEAREQRGWPEIVWCPCDESFQYKGATGRRSTNMIAEMMPYIRHYAPGLRIYMVVWHTKKDNWKGKWQCGLMQKFDKRPDGTDAHQYGPFQVICTNCPNDLDRQTTWDVGGEYWTYTLALSTTPVFSKSRFAFGLNGARHYAGVVYNFADSRKPHNLSEEADVLKSQWITGQFTTNYYLSKDPTRADSIDYALASHTMLGIREGITDRKYIETLRQYAHAKGSKDDIEFLKGLGARIDGLGSAGRGGIDDFTAEIKSEGAMEQLRREIAQRIKALVQ